MEHPQYFYIFCNMLNPITAHNLRVTGAFVSAGAGSWGISKAAGTDFWQKYEDGTAEYIPYVPSDSPNLAGVISVFRTSVTASYRVEYDAEQYRYHNTPLLPSRFSAVYAFRDWETCVQVSDLYGGWDLKTVSVFKLEPGPFNRIAKVNMEIVTLARDTYPYTYFSSDAAENIWQQYWSGGGDLTVEVPKSGGGMKRISSGTVWEYLLEGRVSRIDADPKTFVPPTPA